MFERYAQAGEVLTPGSPALTVGEVSRPWVRVFLAARDVARIKLGQSAVVTLDGVPGAAVSRHRHRHQPPRRVHAPRRTDRGGT